MPTRAIILLVLGVLMVGLGAYVAGRLLFTGGGALTGNRWLDGAFALFFLLRGATNLARARQMTRGGAQA